MHLYIILLLLCILRNYWIENWFVLRKLTLQLDNVYCMYNKLIIALLQLKTLRFTFGQENGNITLSDYRHFGPWRGGVILFQHGHHLITMFDFTLAVMPFCILLGISSNFACKPYLADRAFVQASKKRKKKCRIAKFQRCHCQREIIQTAARSSQVGKPPTQRTKLRKNMRKKYSRMRKSEEMCSPLVPTWGWESGYAPAHGRGT